MTVDEGDSGTRTYTVPVKAHGHLPAKVRLFLSDPRSGATRSWVAAIKPGASRITVPIPVVGNTTYGGDLAYPLTAKAIRNAVVGEYTGGVYSREDDPMPTVTVTPATATATEGSALTWTAHLSAAADNYLYVLLQPLATGSELSTTDVDPDWFTENSGEDPEPSRPLSGTGLQLFAAFEPGTTSAEITVPTVADGAAEGAEHVRFQVLLYPPDFSDPIPVAVVDGTVTD
jgi:hypothetical protein